MGLTNRSDDELDEILTKLENVVSHETVIRMSRSKIGPSPKNIHAEAKLALQAYIEQEVRKAEENAIKRATAPYPYTMPMKSMRSRNTAFKLYAVKFFNGNIRKRHDSMLAALHSPKDTEGKR